MNELISFSHNFEGLKQSPSVSTANNLLKDSCDEDSYLEDSDVDSKDEDLDLDRQIVHQNDKQPIWRPEEKETIKEPNDGYGWMFGQARDIGNKKEMSSDDKNLFEKFWRDRSASRRANILHEYKYSSMCRD
ncbi:hypothetical protein ILUMI_05445 [Ignelater luminosus]|uniref:Uncharacterized protein n=1 Tax=Ignelater luminosus TaxID=2038154 RepID=A0A8K0D7A0_IGNLU|nr:hypothetical protein ILUMI_05445 [Ignelater luminosus]